MKQCVEMKRNVLLVLGRIEFELKSMSGLVGLIKTLR